jgi:hypothetical protein
MPVRCVALSCVALSALLFAAPRAQAQSDTPVPLNLYGSPGLLDMPSARMSPDGSFNLWGAGTGFTQRYGFSFQITPWLEGSFRDVGTKNLFNAQHVFEGGTYYDRSFGLRIRLQDETGGLPAITVGANDLIGTGLEGAEYVVATKHLWWDIDATLGVGWGRYAGTAMFENPFALVFSSFATRTTPTGVVSTSGLPDLSQLFHGPKASIFGGMSWQTPLPGLTLLAEYSSDTYRIEAQQHVFRPVTQVNVGVSYQVTSAIQAGAAFMYGRTPMLRLSATLDPMHEPYDRRVGANPPPAAIRSDDELRRIARENLAASEPAVEKYEPHGETLVAQIKTIPGDCAHYAQMIDAAHDNGFREVAITDISDPNIPVRHCATEDAARFAQQQITLATSWSYPRADNATNDKARDAAVKLAAAQALRIDALSIHETQVDVAFSNIHYRTEEEAYGRLVRVLMATMPDEVETFRIISLVEGIPTRELVLPRASLERTITASGGGSEVLADARTNQTDVMPDHVAPLLVRTPNYDWSIRPVYNQSLFDPNQPYLYQLLAGFNGGVNITPQFRIEGEAQVNIVSDFNQLLPSDSKLPHVRSDSDLYYEHGKNGVAELQASYTATLAPGVYAEARGGILESMFDGVGGEVLWRPEGERWALGATLYEAWQRGFDRLLDLQSYHVTTGHVSLYYQSPWYGLDFEVDAGRYLAGDKGATFTVTRRFMSGVEIGAFATFTNVPFSEFGEGAFDKGFIIRIPMDFMVPLDSQSEFDMNLRPVTRDGGQMLQPEMLLYDELRRTDYGELAGNADALVHP